MYKKINIYYSGEYIYSTNQHKTCKGAKEYFLNRCKGVLSNEIELSLDENRWNHSKFYSAKYLTYPNLIKASFK